MKILDKKIQSTIVRILSQSERILGRKFDHFVPDKIYNIKGSSLQLIRNEILNACNDLKRAVGQNWSEPNIHLNREMIAALQEARFDLSGDRPTMTARGDYDSMSKLRNIVDAGMVDHDENQEWMYTCCGINDVVNYLVPFLDQARAGGIRLREYDRWRKRIAINYFNGLDN